MKKTLPINTGYTIHEFLIPSIGKKFRFRPFLVRENKALMIAQASEDPAQMLNTLKGVVEACCVEETPLDVDKLATFDFEYLLLMLRSISVDAYVNVNVICDDPHEGYEESTRKTTVKVDLQSAEVVGLKEYNPKITLSNQLIIMMRKPLVEHLDHRLDLDNIDSCIDHIAHQIDKIYSGSEVIDVREYSHQELRQWIENLTDAQFQLILAYFKNMPYCRLKIEWTCPHCGKNNVRFIEGLSYFF